MGGSSPFPWWAHGIESSAVVAAGSFLVLNYVWSRVDDSKLRVAILKTLNIKSTASNTVKAASETVKIAARHVTAAKGSPSKQTQAAQTSETAARLYDNALFQCSLAVRVFPPLGLAVGNYIGSQVAVRLKKTLLQLCKGHSIELDHTNPAAAPKKRWKLSVQTRRAVYLAGFPVRVGFLLLGGTVGLYFMNLTLSRVGGKYLSDARFEGRVMTWYRDQRSAKRNAT